MQVKKHIWHLIITGLLLNIVADVAAEQHVIKNAVSEQNCDSVRLLPQGSDRCQFVRDNCSADSLIPYVQLYYCHVRPTGIIATTFFQVFCGFVLLLVFRVLGSTAEDFFSPILTQISQDMGLPPRFAGVTLLALGNGAPDLVSSMAFVRKGQYRIAISGLLGGGMFVAAAVAGLVIWTAGGVKARGALLRDVSCYLISAAVVAALLASGTFTWVKSAFLIGMYVAFVLTVLAADTWHVIRNKGREASPEQEEALLSEHLEHPPQAEFLQEVSPQSDATSIEMTEPHASQYHSMSDVSDRHSLRGPASVGNESRWSVDGRPLSYREKKYMSGQAYRQMALAEMAHSSTFYGGTGMERARRLALLPEDEEDEDVRPQQPGYAAPQLQEDGRPDVEQGSQPEPLSAGDQPAAETEVGEPQGEPGPPIRSPRSHEQDRQERVLMWCNSFTRHHGQLDGSGRSTESARLRGSSQDLLKGDGWLQTGMTLLSIAGTSYTITFTAAELPILLLRRATIPLVDSDSYNRRWFTIAIAGAPLAIIYYLGIFSWSLTFPMALSIGLLFAAVVWMNTEASRPPEWGFGFQFPIGAALIAAFGFVIAAMWIDTIAGELVALLEYLGILSGISHEVLGMTVLAWGNSVGDLSTNSAMAKRGLSNMAMTACFAGPIINLLLSLGLGFMQNLGLNDVAASPVALQAVDLPGFSAIWLNGLCLMAIGVSQQGWVPAWYGAVPMGIYIVYIIVSLSVAFA